MKTYKFQSPGFFKRLQDFMDIRNQDEAVVNTVAQILKDVRQRGDQAVLEYTHRFDGFDCPPAALRISEQQLKAGAKSLSPQDRNSIKEAIACVRQFHRQGLPRNWQGNNPHGAMVGERWYPIQRVGIYIPAGNVPLVSTAVMTTTLARLAGVPEIAVFTPAGKSGEISPQMLGGLWLCGVREVYRIGGAQAVAAMAYGTATIPAVCKIMGPGNAYVAEAQRQVFGTVGVDLLPGPSEAMAIADESANPQWLAADLLAQAEHGSGREKVFYVYSDATQAEAVRIAIKEQVKSLTHSRAIKTVLKRGTAFIQVNNLDEAIAAANFIAPEHLELHVAKNNENRLIKGITTAGAILIGHETPTVIGDFTAGPSHTLPTNRTGRFFSGLKITDFMRRSSLVRYRMPALRRARAVVETFARLENLDAHGRSLEIRLENKKTGK